MIRMFVFIVGVIAAALGLAWLADRPGTMTVEWLGYQIQTSAFVGTLALVAAVVLLTALWAVLRFLLTRPAALAEHFRERRRRQGFEALSRGLIAVGTGDRLLAQRFASVARRALPNEPLTALLKAQAAQLKGDRAAARRSFEAMLDAPDTELLGLRGLFLEAKRQGDAEAARQFVERAVRREPKLGWGVNALFDLQARAGDWPGALDTLAIARQHGHVEPDLAIKRRAALLTAEARDLETAAPDKALARASEAVKLAPGLIPAAEITGRILASKGESRLASRVIARTWRLAPHPDLALVYAYAKPGEAPRERLKRVKYLASLNQGDIEGPIAVATAAIEARDWTEARAALAPHIEERPPARVCALMARIESGEGDKGREREWLARGLRARRDRAWIADGYISDRWLPVSPVTGAVDAFEWKAPVDAIGRGDPTLMLEEQLVPTQAPADPHIAIAASEFARSPKAEISAAGWTGTAAPDNDNGALDRGGANAEAPSQGVAPPSRPPQPAAPKREPTIFTPPPAPDDPGVAQAETDELPTSLERLRAAQIR